MRPTNYLRIFDLMFDLLPSFIVLRHEDDNGVGWYKFRLNP